MTRTGGRRRAAAATAALCLLGAACVDNDKVEAPAAREDAQPGGRLVVAISEPTGVDPALASGPSAALIVQATCDPLIGIDPTSGKLVPAIADSWLISEGGKRFTIKLRKGVRFHDGSELTSDDVVFSLTRVAREETASPLASLLRPIVGYPEIHGEKDADDEARRKLIGLRVIERHSFEILLDKSLAEFIRVLANPIASPVSKRAAERDPAAFGARPMCAGPYRLEAPWQPGEPTIALERAPRYKPVNEGYSRAGKGYADRVELRVLPEPDAQVAAFQSGAVAVAHLPRERLGERLAFGDDAIQSVSPSLEYIGLPTQAPPFDRPAVRMALSQALDRRGLATGVLNGGARPARGFLPPSLGPVHRSRGCGAFAPLSGDVAGARRTLARAGVDLSGQRTRLYFNDEFGHRRLVEGVARQWKDAFGLEAELVPMPWQTYLSTAQAASGFDGPFRLSTSSEWSSPDAYLEPLFGAASIGGTNFSRFEVVEFDRYLKDVARRSSDLLERRRDYQRLEDIVCQRMPVIPIDFPLVTHLVRRSNVGSARGTFTDRTTGDILLRELFVRQSG